MSNELPYHKAKKLWKEFPYLWGVLQDWNPRYEIRIQRLDYGALGRIVSPSSNSVFLHLTRIGEPFRAFDGKKLQDWRVTLEEVLIGDPRPLADSLFESEAVRLCKLCKLRNDEGLVIDAVVVLETIQVSGVNTPSRHDADVIIIYKPPRDCSIYNLVVSKWMSLHAHVGVRA